MVRTLSKEEAQAWAFFIVLAIVSLSILILEIKIGIIHFYQNMFWISFFVLTPLFFLLSIIFLIWGIFKKEEQDSWGYYYNPRIFSKSTILILSGGFFLLCFLSLLFVPYCYERGYSNEALQKLAEYQNDLESLQQIQSILTGQIIWDIQNQVIEETINNLCKDPNYPCEQVRQSYQVYKDIKGDKDDADKIAGFFGWINKLESDLSKK